MPFHNLNQPLSLGELNSPYNDFLLAVKEFCDFSSNKFYELEIETMSAILHEQKKALRISATRHQLSQKSLLLSNRSLARDSSLYGNRAISELEYELAKSKSYSISDLEQITALNLSSANEKVRQSESQIQETRRLRIQKNSQLLLQIQQLRRAFLDLCTKWKQRYLIVAPINGISQHINFVRNLDYVQNNQHLFTIIPKEDTILGQIYLPVSGAGKVTVGQVVNVRLEDYPYLEYGTLSGRVRSISQTSASVRAGDSNLESYLVTASFGNGLTTNYGYKLNFRHDIRGTAEIVTNKRLLIERFFENVRYVFSKN